MTNVTYLQLAPEFGGTKYGPFRGAEIRLGSDPATNDITIPASVGVLPQHLKILQQSESTFIVAPVERTASVFIWRENSNKPKQITTPMAVTVNDGFSLVTPEGYRFYIVAEVAQREKGSKVGDGFADKAMKRMPTSRGLLEEVKRRGFAKVFTSNLGNSAMYAWRFVATGQIFSPMYIVAGLLMLSSWLFVGGLTCSSFSLNRSKNVYAQKLSDCKGQLEGNDGEEGGPNIPTLTRNILNNDSLRGSLREDRALYKEFADQLDKAFTNRGDYEVHYKSERGAVGKLRAGLSGNPDSLLNSLTMIAALPSKGEREWRIVQDSEGAEVCGRGPLALTYRQARNLGLEKLQPDALVSNSDAESQDMQLKLNLLTQTVKAAGVIDANLAGVRIIDPGGAGVTGGRECMHVEGDDDRTDIPALVRALGRQFGPKASGLPGENESHWITARLVKLAAMDFITYSDLKFQSNKAAIAYLESQEPSTARVDFAKRFAARTMAQGIVVRCSAILDKDMDQPPPHIGPPPEFTQCLIIRGLVEYGRL